jgi:3-hydroxyisobutyrate dehydrogenase-like beta-hydroxyacid dehydrogenase
MKLGFIGFGEVGSQISRGLKGEGLEGIVAHDVLQQDPARGGPVKERAESAGVALLDSPRAVATAVDIVMVAVPGGAACAAAGELCAHLRPGLLYVDLTTASPDEKRACDQQVRATGALFVDAAIMARAAVYGHKLSIMASGNGADQMIRQLAPYGMQIEKVSEQAGDATAIKFVRSIFSKGFPALMVEVLEAAAVMKVEHLVLKTLSATMNAQPFEDVAKYHVTGSSIHAVRHLHEMESVVEMLEKLKVNPAMTRATCERLQWLAAMDLKATYGDTPPEDWQDIVRPWLQARAKPER